MKDKTKNNKDIKSKIIIAIGLFNLLISLLFVKDNFETFLFFFIIFSICFIYSRKLIFIIASRPIIKKIYKLHIIKFNLQEEIKQLELNKNKILDYISNNKENIDMINQLILKEKQLRIEVIKLENKKQTIKKIIEQEELINRAIKGEETTFNILSQENDKLKDEKQKLIENINHLREQIIPIERDIKFLNKCTLDYVDSLEGFEFEKFCVELLEINGYENVQNTQESIDYGIDIIAEKDNIVYAIQCKRYEGKVGNDAIQEAMTGKEYYNGNIAIVLTNSTFTQNAQRLAKSAGVILWDRTILHNMMERNKQKNIIETN